jgi:hypothetical protein
VKLLARVDATSKRSVLSLRPSKAARANSTCWPERRAHECGLRRLPRLGMTPDEFSKFAEGLISAGAVE